jgi:hypothetical protein
MLQSVHGVGNELAREKHSRIELCGHVHPSRPSIEPKNLVPFTQDSKRLC